MCYFLAFGNYSKVKASESECVVDPLHELDSIYIEENILVCVASSEKLYFGVMEALCYLKSVLDLLPLLAVVLMLLFLSYH